MADYVASRRRAKAYFWNNPQTRSILIQTATLGLLAWFLFIIVLNTVKNLSRMNQTFGYDFLSRTAGFDIVQSLIAYTSVSSYGRALLVGVLNTVLVSVMAIVTATVLGFLIGIMQLSKNRLARACATIYIEFFRNIPILLQIFVWYSLIVLQVLPMPRDAVNLAGVGFLSNRGLVLPRPVLGEGAILGLIGLALAVAAIIALRQWARRRQMRTGQPFRLWPVAVALLIVGPVAGLGIAGFPVTFDVPVKTAFNFRGGMFLLPELMALFLALSIYYATYIAEAVRAGIQSVSGGQMEAAQALGVSRSDAMWRIVIPQAMRVIIPPLISIFLGITKTSSLGVAIGYADVVAIGGTVLNQTGKAIEVVTIWMIVYLGLNLLTSLLMNWFNARMKLVER